MTNLTRSLIQHKTSGDVYVTDGERITGALYYGDYQTDGEITPGLDLGDFELDHDAEGLDLSDYRTLLSE